MYPRFSDSGGYLGSGVTITPYTVNDLPPPVNAPNSPMVFDLGFDFPPFGYGYFVLICTALYFLRGK